MVKTPNRPKNSLGDRKYYTGVFMKDIAELNIEKPEYTKRQSISMDAAVCEELDEKGFAYETQRWHLF